MPEATAAVSSCWPYPVSAPALLPAMHHHIVALERMHQPLPDTFDFPPSITYDLTVYERPDASLLASRVRDATIIIITTTKVPAEILHPDVTPKLQLVAVMASGTDPVDLEACRKRGIRVTNCPAANIDSVSEHAISLYFATRRRTVLLDRLTRKVPSEWKEKRTLLEHMKYADGTPPLTCKDEVMGVVGYGALGRSPLASGDPLVGTHNGRPTADRPIMQANASQSWGEAWACKS